MTTILSNIPIYKKNFAGRVVDKFAVKWILNIPPHLAYVATLPCETLMSERADYKASFIAHELNQSVTHVSVATVPGTDWLLTVSQRTRSPSSRTEVHCLQCLASREHLFEKKRKGPTQPVLTSFILSFWYVLRGSCYGNASDVPHRRRYCTNRSIVLTSVHTNPLTHRF